MITVHFRIKAASFSAIQSSVKTDLVAMGAECDNERAPLVNKCRTATE